MRFSVFKNLGYSVILRLEAVYAAAKSLQSCLTLCDPIDGSPPGSPIPGTLQARTLEWVAISYSNAWKWKVEVKSCSRVQLFATPWTAAYQAPPSMGFSKQEYWSGVPLPSPEAVYKTLIIPMCVLTSPSFPCFHKTSPNFRDAVFPWLAPLSLIPCGNPALCIQPGKCLNRSRGGVLTYYYFPWAKKVGCGSKR